MHRLPLKRGRLTTKIILQSLMAHYPSIYLFSRIDGTSSKNNFISEIAPFLKGADACSLRGGGISLPSKEILKYKKRKNNAVLQSKK